MQNSKGECRNGKEIHGCDDLAMIAQEGSPEFPCLVGKRQALDIARDGTFGAVKAESPQLGICLLSAFVCTGSNSPEQTKTSAVPGDNRFWLNDDQHVAPGRPKPAGQNPKYSIVDLQPRARILSFENAQLLTSSNDLDAEVVTGTEEAGETGEKSGVEWKHNPGHITLVGIPTPDFTD
jgi:hypothetical protein